MQTEIHFSTDCSDQPQTTVSLAVTSYSPTFSGSPRATTTETFQNSDNFFKGSSTSKIALNISAHQRDNLFSDFHFPVGLGTVVRNSRLILSTFTHRTFFGFMNIYYSQITNEKAKLFCFGGIKTTIVLSKKCRWW